MIDFFQIKIRYQKVASEILSRYHYKKKARSAGNSVFVDENLVAYENQWAFLAGLKKIDRIEVESLVQQAEKKGRVIGVRLDVPEEDNPTPWNKPPFRHETTSLVGDLPKKLNLIVGNEIYIDKSVLTPALKNRLIRHAAFQNPEFYKAQAMRLPVFDKPRIISCAHHYALWSNTLSGQRQRSSRRTSV